jgi:two-component system, cell cycle sensor histidine kinase and response regulator CckA
VPQNIEVVARLNPELGLLMADPHHMQQVLINLVVNARDAMPRGGRLTLATANLSSRRRAGRQRVPWDGTRISLSSSYFDTQRAACAGNSV